MSESNGKTPEPRYDRDDVRRAAGNRGLDLLANVAGIDRKLLDGNHHPCPKCGGDDRFRMLDGDKGAVRCNRCFSEKCGDYLAAVGWMHGVNFPGALKLCAEYLGVPPIEPEKRKSKRKPFDRQVAFDAEPHRGWLEKWAAIKRGASVETVLRTGARTGFWQPRDGIKPAVVAFPASLTVGGPVVGTDLFYPNYPDHPHETGWRSNP